MDDALLEMTSIKRCFISSTSWTC